MANIVLLDMVVLIIIFKHTNDCTYNIIKKRTISIQINGIRTRIIQSWHKLIKKILVQVRRVSIIVQLYNPTIKDNNIRTKAIIVFTHLATASRLPASQWGAN